MANYQEIRRQIENLNLDEQVVLLTELVGMLQHQMMYQSRHNIIELEGLGKDIWQGFNAQEYINQERNSWPG